MIIYCERCGTVVGQIRDGSFRRQEGGEVVEGPARCPNCRLRYEVRRVKSIQPGKLDWIEVTRMENVGRENQGISRKQNRASQ